MFTIWNVHKSLLYHFLFSGFFFFFGLPQKLDSDTMELANHSDEVVIDMLRVLEEEVKVKSNAYKKLKKQFDSINGAS